MPSDDGGWGGNAVWVGLGRRAVIKCEVPHLQRWNVPLTQRRGCKNITLLEVPQRIENQYSV